MKIKLLIKRFAFTVLLLTIFCKPCHAQVAAQNLFIEIGGPGLLFSANYDTRLTAHRGGIGIRAGLGYFGVDNTSLLSVPLQVNYLLGEEKQYFEIGLGATYASLRTSSDNFLFGNAPGQFIGTATFGYRFQPLNSGFNFRANIDPVFDAHNFYPFWFGLSFGYTIK
jgi:hypothetical protein